MTAITFQTRVQPWLLACFGAEIAADRSERNHRFLEESLELVQSCGCTASEAHQLVDYVFGRPVGEPAQEAGGVMVTLAALCLANSLDMHQAGETELARIWTKVEAIRAKQAAKPKHSPLPAAPAAVAGPAARKVFLVATGETSDGAETYTRHDDAPPPLSDAECLYTSPAAPALEAPAAPALPAAYQGGMFATTPDGGTVTLRFSDASAGEQWFERLTDGFDTLAAAPQAPTGSAQ